MKKVFIIGMIVAAMTTANVQAWEFYDTYNAMEPQENVKPIKFRGLEWYCSTDDVTDLLLSEGKTSDDVSVHDTADILMTDYVVAGFDMLGAYAFGEDESFTTGIYESQEKHIIHQEYYDDFLTLQDALISVYGDVTLNDDQFYLDSIKGDEDLYGVNVAFGAMSLSRGWMDADGAAIVLTMTGEDGSVDIAIYYLAPGLSFSPQPDVPNTDGL